jgi:sugar phosphate permease
VLSDLFPVKRRGQILAWFYAAIPFGGALGYALGAEVVRATGDWRYAFYAVVPPGILLGVWAFLMPEPPRGHADQVQTGKGKERFIDYLILARTPSYVLNTVGMTFMCFAMGGLAYWVPDYLKYRDVQPLFGLDPATAFGAMTALAGLIATLTGGWAGDALRGRFSGSYFLVSGTAMLLAFPQLLLMIWLPFPLAWLPLAGFVFCLFFNTGPTNTILANVTHPLLRAPGFALNILIIHLFGDAISPPVMGVIADHTNLNVAFYCVSGAVLLGGLFWLWGAMYLKRDTELAPTRSPRSNVPLSTDPSTP